MEKRCKLTVGELIEVLKALPQDMPVYIQGMEEYYIYKTNNSVIIDTELLEESEL